MAKHSYSDDAEDCRRFAEEVGGEADKAMLHRIAREFERLAEEVRHADRPYYVARATQEVTAAVKAVHPQARLAHLTMARHYEALTHLPSIAVR
ncbi:hypothetical protein HMF7854_12090 [Sphingomonas ginkgonis]|uniref:Uncharacterized protein n=1 Tax=Sphingomonas ginkgonis TaxID=2315330 RepID=A0A3R9YN04_9SPHN|nr:hypothetical protein [Sphingomonas ginkgonis]RST31495.1 hypothetical protein HMF7854_12090 [Sphingomonas ginkgonis]